MNSSSRFRSSCLVLAAAVMMVSSAGCSAGRPALQAAPETYPIASDVYTTLQRTIVPGAKPPTAIRLDEISRYRQYGYGDWTFGPPLKAEVRLDLMPALPDGSAAARGERVLSFFTLTDVHVTDKESPNQLIYLQSLHPTSPFGISVHSGVMLYTPHVLDAAVQTVNALHRRSPFDFGISLGDVCNSTQRNELRWYIDVLDGKVVAPSSGAHLGASTIDYQKPFQAAGLDRSIPWYQALGNHDHFWIGSIPVDHGLRKDLRESYVAGTVFATGDVLKNPAAMTGRDYYMGVLDGSTPYGDVVHAGPAAGFKAPPQVAPDPERRSLLRSEWMREFQDTSSKPAGHGFTPAAVGSGFACYSFVPKSAVPMKVIVLDDTQAEDDGSADIHGHGFLDRARWDWLRKELADGDAAGQLMIVAAHVPIGVEPTAPTSELGWWTDPRNAVTLPALVSELQGHPGLLMWISGHRHSNAVKAFPSPDPSNAPEKGFWEVETASLRDFPQQFRTFDVYLNGSGTVSIVTTDVDPAVREGTPAATSRRYAIAAQQIVGADVFSNNPTADPTIRPMPTASYNAVLLKQLSPETIRRLKPAAR